MNEIIFDKITFYWNNGNSELRLHDRTLSKAMMIAKSFGFTERKWYRPSTWSNGFITFNFSAKEIKNV